MFLAELPLPRRARNGWMPLPRCAPVAAHCEALVKRVSCVAAAAVPATVTVPSPELFMFVNS